MTNLSRPLATLFALLFCSISLPCAAQVTTADYERAGGLREKYEALALNVPGAATWVEKTHRFWYRRSVKGGNEFVLVDADTVQKRPPCDYEKLAATLAKMTGRKITAVTLPINTFTFRQRARHRSALRRRDLDVRAGGLRVHEGAHRRRVQFFPKFYHINDHSLS